jgi:putative copper export protein/methionine-rich copper-binding protein CopC
MRTVLRALTERIGWIRALALLAIMALSIVAWPGAIAQAHGFQPHGVLSPRSSTQRGGPMHALPVRYYPAPNAVLRALPPYVQIVFSEHVNPDISEIVVVDPSNREVDNRDSHVSADGYTMTVSLPLLPAGTYVVFWRTHSADDGHVAAGSYLFHIAHADGTVPPLSGPLPTGHFPGGAGTATASLSGASLFSALARWAAVVALTLLLGMIFWITVVQPRQPPLSVELESEMTRQMCRVARWTFLVLLLGTLGEIAGQLVLLDGTFAGLVSGPFWRSVLLQSRFGGFLLARIGLTLLGLGILLLLERFGDRVFVEPRARDLAMGTFGLGVAMAFEYSGHGGAAPAWWGSLVDYLHLVANGIWLGGLFTLASVIVPALLRADAVQRRAYLAESIPAFSVPALAAVGFLAVTGPLNGAVRLSSLQQVWTTPYGLVLIAKSLLFLSMVAISYHHAFRLRPYLDAKPGASSITLRAADLPVVGNVLARVLLVVAPSRSGTLGGAALSVSKRPMVRRESDQDVDHFSTQIMTWMRTEAALGLGILLCASLLGPLAGTLTPTVSSTGSFGAQGGTQTLTQKADTLSVTLRVDPGKFGTNTFSLLVDNPDGTPASGGSVFLVASMIEMDMGTTTINLTPASAPGTYTGQGELPMAGHWRLDAVIRTLQDPNHLHRTTFTVGVSY